MRKNIDLSDKCVEILSIRAIKNGTDFKNYVQAILENEAKHRSVLEKPKKCVGKN